MAGNKDFDLYKVSEEHDELRKVVRSLPRRRSRRSPPNNPHRPATVWSPVVWL
ncbi:hypothetical protein [Streptomyces thioluteus]|uniref:hypothetical protein n=1 Tax=Streptomyces thioluteus TaxID=66431 RepID=UPI0031EB785B